MVRGHLYASDRGRIRIDQIPVLSTVGTPPQARGMGIHGIGIFGIEREEIYHAAQIEHAPGRPTVVRDVGTAHVT